MSSFNNMTEKLCLRWNDFKNNTCGAFASLREDTNFADVTLACDDGKQVEAHKVVLAASSPLLQDLLKLNRHPHPLIFMRGVKSEDLLAIVDFLYFGEANVNQESLDSFLTLAAELKVKGLLDKAEAFANSLREPKMETSPSQADAEPRFTAKIRSLNIISPLKVEAGEFCEVIPVVFEDTAANSLREPEMEISPLREKAEKRFSTKKSPLNRSLLKVKAGEFGQGIPVILEDALREPERHISSAEAETRFTVKKRPLKKFEDGEFGEVIPVIFEDTVEWKELDEKIQALMEKSCPLKRLPTNKVAYKCKVCGKEGQKSAINEHIEANHLDGTSISCNYCDKILATRHSLKQHTTMQHTTISYPQLEDSMEWNELDDKIQALMENSCPEKKLPTNKVAYKCKVCGKEGQNSAIKEHIEANHLDGISISCNYCDKILATRHSLKQHTTMFHPQAQLIDSREWKELDDQIQTLMEKSGNTISGRERLTHKCKVCGKEGQKSAIKEHIEANHLDGISLSCNYCGKIHGTRHALKQHIVLCHQP